MRLVFDQVSAPRIVNRRAAQRYAHDCRVDVFKDYQRISTGRLIDISCHGAAIRCHCLLAVGEKCTLSFAGIGSFPAKIVRSFNSNCYGAVFEIESSIRDRLDRSLLALNLPEKGKLDY